MLSHSAPAMCTEKVPAENLHAQRGIDGYLNILVRQLLHSAEFILHPYRVLGHLLLLLAFLRGHDSEIVQAVEEELGDFHFPVQRPPPIDQGNGLVRRGECRRSNLIVNPINCLGRSIQTSTRAAQYG